MHLGPTNPVARAMIGKPSQQMKMVIVHAQSYEFDAVRQELGYHGQCGQATLSDIEVNGL